VAHAYTPGLKAAKYETVRRERRLPIQGEVVVEVGDEVKPDQVVAKTQLPGDPVSINIANRMGVQADEVPSAMLVEEGDFVEQGETIARSTSFFGLFKHNQEAPTDGVIEMISSVTGQIVMRAPPIPLELSAYISGNVVEVMPEEGVVVETEASFVQGIFGIGGERSGEVKVLVDDSSERLTADSIDDDCHGKIIVVGELASTELLHKADEVGAIGVVAGGIIDEDLVDYLGNDIGVAITGQENIPITVIITEGFGPMRIADKTFELLKFMDGRGVSLNGATQIRAGVMRPEIVCPFDSAVQDEFTGQSDGSDDSGLDVGTPIRIIREPYFGELAEVTELPPDLQVIESEAKVRVLRAELQNGTKVTVPRANVEIIET